MKIEPLRQGDLDGLCSFYASLNAIRYHLADSCPLTLDRDYEYLCEIFDGIFSRKTYNLNDVIEGVVDHKKPLKFIKEYSKKFDFSYTVTTVNSMSELTALIDRGPVVIGFSGLDFHWTVMVQHDNSFIHLFDSFIHEKFSKSDVVFTDLVIPEKVCISPTEKVILIN